jgi:hypothetical protein
MLSGQPSGTLLAELQRRTWQCNENLTARQLTYARLGPCPGNTPWELALPTSRPG